MKRILAILCVIACLCGLCVPAMAAGTITVSVKAPDDWAKVSLYCWDDNKNEMATWPGNPMTKGADGLWTAEVPAGKFTNVIANNDNNGAQTADLKMDGSADCWIDAIAGVVYTDSGFSKPFGGNAGGNNGGSASGPVDLSGLNGLALVGAGIPGVSDWSPSDAAGEMVKESDGIYTKVIAAFANSPMQIKIAGNDDWVDAYNFGAATDGTPIVLGTKADLTVGGGSQNFALSVDKDCNLKFTVDLTGDVPTVLVEETDEDPTTGSGNGGSTVVPEGEMITVYAKFPADWKGACVWAWKEPGPVNATNAAWPGDLYLVQGADGWWSVQVPNWINCLLINGNGGAVQTPDIKELQAGKDLWINAYTDPQNPVVSYEVITDIVEPTTQAPVDTTIRPTEGLKSDDSNTNTENKGGKDQTVLWAVVGSVVIIAVAAVIIIIGKGKKNA